MRIRLGIEATSNSAAPGDPVFHGFGEKVSYRGGNELIKR
jgi:hypothetical protein